MQGNELGEGDTEREGKEWACVLGSRLQRGRAELQCSHSACGTASRASGARNYAGSAAQGRMLLTEMLSPLHLRTPASHSVIVCSLPFTSTQTLNPASSHSEAALQTHSLPSAGKRSERGLMAPGGGGGGQAYPL